MCYLNERDSLFCLLRPELLANGDSALKACSKDIRLASGANSPLVHFSAEE